MSREIRGMDRESAREQTIPAEDLAQPAPSRSYLLVFERDSSWVFPLPAAGDVVIGRAEGVDLRLQDGSVSRMHARISVLPGEYRLADLNSQNGIFVNAERVATSRALVSGDTITLGNVTLMFHAAGRRPVGRTFVDFVSFGQRGDQEIERSLRSGRPWAVVSLLLGKSPADRPLVSSALSAEMRAIDAAAWSGLAEVLVLLPETTAPEALQRARALLAAAAPHAPAARAGVAIHPMDGGDMDTLLASARAAAHAAEPETVGEAARTFRTLEIGGRRAVVADPAMQRLFDFVARLAQADMPVLIHGETGCGKELVALAIHYWSQRREKPLVTFSCAALPETLVESELFGYEKGAFTGAVSPKQGLMEAAIGGTLFLDEVGELPPSAQAKLLRALETKRIRPLGELREHEADIRIVAATNRNLEEEVNAGGFRKDLYYRLKGATVWIPPLRDRPRELPILAQYFLDEACVRVGRTPMAISVDAMRRLAAHSWPGNVRELQSLMEYAAAVSQGDVLEPRHLLQWTGGAALTPTTPAPPPPEAEPAFRPIEEEIRQLERLRMSEALDATGGNQTRAAELIGMPLRTFQDKMKAYGLQALARSRKQSRPLS